MPETLNVSTVVFVNISSKIKAYANTVQNIQILYILDYGNGKLVLIQNFILTSIQNTPKCNF